jgi:hypothetical protein
MSGAQDQLSLTRELSCSCGRAQEQSLISYLSGIMAEKVVALLGVFLKSNKRPMAEGHPLLHKELLEQANAERTALR